MQKNNLAATSGPVGNGPELDISGYLPQRLAAGGRTVKGATTPAAVSALEGALDRLEMTLSAETEALESQREIGFAELNRQKSQSLLEITRLARALPQGPDASLQARLAPLRARLSANQRLLGFHLEAVREVSDLMVGILSDAESDGTYGQTRSRRDIRA
jgi:hypothetical protein